MREEVFIQSYSGRIEGRFYNSGNKNLPAILLLPPDPKLKASINNKVMRALYQLFVEKGFSVLTINYRGVGKSDSATDQANSEIPDASAALDWIYNNIKNFSSVWVAGFSFGSWIGMQLLMRRPDLKNFISISPPVTKYDFSFLSPCPVPGIIVHGEDDSVVPISSVETLIEILEQQKENQFIHYKSIKGANHLFSSQEERDKLCSVISAYVDEKLESSEIIEEYSYKHTEYNLLPEEDMYEINEEEEEEEEYIDPESEYREDEEVLLKEDEDEVEVEVDESIVMIEES